jgi:phosphatidylinositol dimannoside acyltransferase
MTKATCTLPGGRVRGVRARAVYLAYRAGADVARFLPPRPGEAAARALSRVLTVTSPARRRQVTRNLSRVTNGSLSGPALTRTVSEVFDNYARYWHELFRLPGRTVTDLETRFACEGFENIEQSQAAGRGTILALPHLGNWDVAGAWLAGRGLGATVVAEPVEPRELFDWFVGTREQLGMQVVPLGPRAGADVLLALRENRVVCLLCDRDLTGDGIEVEFFGEATTLPGGPATMALRTGAALLPVGVYFRPGGGHLARILGPVPAVREGRLRDDVQRVTQLLASRFETLIRAAPEQWLMMQPNWPSDRPEPESPEPESPERR